MAVLLFLTEFEMANYYTQEGLDKLKEELQQLKGEERSKIAKQIAEARDKGDLSENAEYDAAKDAQGLLEMKISKLETLVADAKVIDASQLDASKVSILCKVKIKNTGNGMEFSYMIVAEEEANLAEGKISIQSPIGKGLLGKKVGDKADIQIPAGKVKFEILDISL